MHSGVTSVVASAIMVAASGESLATSGRFDWLKICASYLPHHKQTLAPKWLKKCSWPVLLWTIIDNIAVLLLTKESQRVAK